MENKNVPKDKFKLYFFYFLVVSLLVIGVFFIIIFGTFWNYYSKIWRIEDFYGQKQQELSTNVP
ncbi:MAG: hypothetical protein PHC97_04630, partial [Patescibacteria group bacterium]|nr:hypothetical protein [Patescibacteria group bacterium]